MKNEFIGFYESSEEEVNQSWTAGVFVFDTNMLLNLYRYTESTRRDFFLVLEKLKEKLYLPYQVALEYYTNRRTVIHNLDTPFRDCERIFREVIQKTLKEKLSNYQRHPSIDMASLDKITSEFLEKIEAELSVQKTGKPDFLKKDEVRGKLDQIFDGRMGKDFSEKELADIFSEGSKRYDKKVPPGYMDAEKDKEGKSNGRKIYGDYIIWKDLLNYAKREKKNIIFITADSKEDWWATDAAGKIPRPELIKEFTEFTGQSILIYDAEDFLKEAKERGLANEVSNNSIEEVKEIRESEENIQKVKNIRNFLVHNYNNIQFDSKIQNLADIKNGLDFSAKEWQEIINQSPNFVNAYKIIEAIKNGGYFPTREEYEAMQNLSSNVKNIVDRIKLEQERYKRELDSNNHNEGNK